MIPRHQRIKKFDIHAFIRGIILLGFISLLTWLSITEQLVLYINPKFLFLVNLSCFLLIPMFVIQTLDAFTSTNVIDSHYHHVHTGHWIYIPFLTVLILAFALPDNTLNANLINSRGLNNSINIALTPTQGIPRPLATEFQQINFIKVTDLNYTEAISEITDFPKEYIGKQITMIGFVFRSPGLGSNQLSLVRYVVMCCTADTLPYGIMCEIPDAQKYPDGSWLSIEGTIQMSRYKNKDVAAIKIISAKQIAEPKQPYIFPYN